MRHSNLTQMQRVLLLVIFMLAPMLLPAANTFGVSNNVLNEKFDLYEKTLQQLITAITQTSWSESEHLALSLTHQGQELLALGHTDNNAIWEYYASNLIHHGVELQEASKKHDTLEAIRLFATLTNHIGEIQSAIPAWLLDYLNQQIKILEQGIAEHDPKRIRDAAEILHNAANKIILSASTSRQSYRHTRWITNILDINRLGDELVGDINNDDWDTRKQHLQKIKTLYATWKDGFHPSAIQ
ncbi:MAG: hypothetical protein HQL94_00990 [Magnetococcales bacterium]|nr:hypothetical protein [Magnetococcales bacterium]